jgi:hypothetical protein
MALAYQIEQLPEWRPQYHTEAQRLLRALAPRHTVASRNGKCFAYADILVNLDHQLAGWSNHKRATPGRTGGRPMSWVRIGQVKAAVLPVPVWAMPITSLPARIGGMAVD